MWSIKITIEIQMKWSLVPAKFLRKKLTVEGRSKQCQLVPAV